MTTIRRLAEDLEHGRTTASQLVEQALAAIVDPEGEGSLTFLHVDDAAARAAAASFDALRQQGVPLPPFAGIPLAVKDLFDVQGQVTTAGSVVLADQPPAAADAVAVERLRRAGFIVIGRTNMTEFAYSGLGLNSHYGTPKSSVQREQGLIPGGSSSGSAVAVADGMAVLGLGTDTGGSCRIPAAFNGLVGFKPTAARVPLDGCYPLAASLDSIGPIARTVDCCAIADHFLSGGDGLMPALGGLAPDRIRLGVLREVAFDDIDPAVAEATAHALARLADAGITVIDAPFPELAEIRTLNRFGGLVAAEAWAQHRSLLEERGDRYDKRVGGRIERGRELTAEYYIEVAEGRRRLQAAAARRLAGFDAFVAPTVAITPPPIDWFDHGPNGDDPDFYGRVNLLALRNTSIGNFLDTCSISLPVGNEPVGLMLIGRPHGDRALLDVATTVEAALASPDAAT